MSKFFLIILLFSTLTNASYQYDIFKIGNQQIKLIHSPLTAIASFNSLKWKRSIDCPYGFWAKWTIIDRELKLDFIVRCEDNEKFPPNKLSTILPSTSNEIDSLLVNNDIAKKLTLYYTVSTKEQCQNNTDLKVIKRTNDHSKPIVLKIKNGIVSLSKSEIKCSGNTSNHSTNNTLKNSMYRFTIGGGFLFNDLGINTGVSYINTSGFTVSLLAILLKNEEYKDLNPHGSFEYTQPITEHYFITNAMIGYSSESTPLININIGPSLIYETHNDWKPERGNSDWSTADFEEVETSEMYPGIAFDLNIGFPPGTFTQSILKKIGAVLKYDFILSENSPIMELQANILVNIFE